MLLLAIVKFVKTSLQLLIEQHFILCPAKQHIVVFWKPALYAMRLTCYFTSTNSTSHPIAGSAILTSLAAAFPTWTDARFNPLTVARELRPTVVAR